jgi:hypothetical protein
LFARSHILSEMVSTGLPDNQWQLEVLGWFETSLAKFQGSIMEYAYKRNLDPALTVWSPYGLTPNGSLTSGRISALQDQCRNQLVQTAGEVQNFSFLGVLVVVSVSVILILLNICMPGVLKLVSRHSVGRRARQADDKLHLLRIALADAGGASGSSQWQLGAWDVPVIPGGIRVVRPDMAGDLTTYAYEAVKNPSVGSSLSDPWSNAHDYSYAYGRRNN